MSSHRSCFPRAARSARGRVTIMFVCLALAMASCTSTETTTKTDTAQLTLAVENLGSQLYAPWLSGQENRVVAMLVGDTLTTVDPKTNELKGGLAESWTLSPDQKTWDFKLRADVPFQDGYGNLTADDVKLSWQQWLNPASVQDPPANQLKQAIDQKIENFEVVGPLEFKLHTEHPVVSLPYLLSDSGSSLTIQSKKYFDEKGAEANKHPLGTGPFKFVSNTPGVQVVLEATGTKHPFRETPSFKKIVLREIPDSAARLAQVQSGAVDMAFLSPDLVGEAKAAGLTLFKTGEVESCAITLGGYYLGTPALDRDAPWVQADDPAKGLAVRQAMSLAIDRKTIVDKLVPGFGDLTYGPIVNWPDDPQQTDPSWQPPAYDVALAKQKLAEGGYPNGFPVTFRAFEQVQVAQAVVDMWNKIGLKVKFEQTEQALMRPLFRASNAPPGTSKTDGMVWIYCASRYPSPEMGFSNAWVPTGGTKQAFPVGIQQAYDAMNAEPDAAKRYAISRDLVVKLHDDVMPINLFAFRYPWVAGPKIGAYTPIPGVNILNAVESIKPKNP
jgi:peptide/nickel transport system substrate-binding protein